MIKFLNFLKFLAASEILTSLTYFRNSGIKHYVDKTLNNPLIKNNGDLTLLLALDQ